MSGYTDFYVSWEGCSAFGNTPSRAVPVVTPSPLIIPEPLARFDFNNYIDLNSIISNDVSGGDPASINEPSSNIFNTLDASNNFLEIYAPDIYPSQTGGVIAPSLSNVAALEIWVNYTIPESFYSQYFVDARTGATNAYWITNGSSDTIGDFFTGATIYFNTLANSVDISGGTPSLPGALVGWTQVVIVPTSTITDDIAFLVRYTGEQGMPASVADIALYDTALTSDQVKAIYNNKCSRYGLSPVV